MYFYIFKRLLLMIPTLLGAAALVFVLMRLIPGDICVMRLATGGGSINPEVLKSCRLELGMDRPVLVQFLLFLKGLATFDLGKSMWTGRPIVDEIGLRFQLSLQVAIMATITAIMIAIPLGIISAVKQNTWIDYVVRAFSIAGVAMPSFWLGILIILGILITSKAWFGSPWMPPIKYVPIWVDPFYNLSMLIWPALATGYRYSAVATRMTRSAMLEVLREDYVRTARAKGVFQKLVIRRHALRNALLPVITNIGLEIPFLFTGAIVTETIFSWPGIGKLTIDATREFDYPILMGVLLVTSVLVVFANLLADVAYGIVDPRIKY